jgi:YbgC/YbaW family acyl-CoA thioester hydrolase
VFTTSFAVEWGDCDEAGIVYYPRYFYWMDCAFHRFLRARGLSYREFKQRFGAELPLVDAGGHFSAPLTYDNEFHIRVQVAEWQERRFRLTYDLVREDKQIASGFEVRAWAFAEGGRLRGGRIPEDFRELIEREHGG